eukprot:GHVU01180469.1.p1 GENE.GHVU01180469.1~~GHVU01180469.1.p1  ORF type:complete len:187 (+),score=5.21 GHVU01180469.1:224-784(+)
MGLTESASLKTASTWPGADDTRVTEGDIKQLQNQVVVIAVDGSKASDRAFQWYVDHLYKTSHRVWVVHSCEPQFPSGKYSPDYLVPPEQWAEKIDASKVKGQKLLSGYETRMNNLGIDGETHMDFGRAGPNIVQAANQVGATSIIIGTHGLGTVRRTILGSVSHHVVHHVNVPVTIVPDPDPRCHT